MLHYALNIEDSFPAYAGNVLSKTVYQSHLHVVSLSEHIPTPFIHMQCREIFTYLPKCCATMLHTL